MGQIDRNTVRAGAFSTSLSTMDRSSSQKNKHGNTGLKLYIRPNGHNRHI